MGWGRDPAPPTPLGVLPSGLHHSPNPLQLPQHLGTFLTPSACVGPSRARALGKATGTAAKFVLRAPPGLACISCARTEPGVHTRTQAGAGTRARPCTRTRTRGPSWRGPRPPLPSCLHTRVRAHACADGHRGTLTATRAHTATRLHARSPAHAHAPSHEPPPPDHARPGHAHTFHPSPPRPCTHLTRPPPQTTRTHSHTLTPYPPDARHSPQPSHAPPPSPAAPRSPPSPAHTPLCTS